MQKSKILSGEELVAKGATKHEASLPENGLKDVVPNGSWLEQKQIQAALETRKQLIEVERIEKSGALSHAKWNETLQLAEVTQQAGSHWKYLGHCVGKQLFLRPEEALFLIEVNSLRLTYNNVVVPLQQAYSLLLRHKVNILQYKVYASLSRLGYKIYRHESFTHSQNNTVIPIENSFIDENSASQAESHSEETVTGVQDVSMENIESVISDKCTEATCELIEDSENAKSKKDSVEPKQTPSRKELKLQKLRGRKWKSLSKETIFDAYEHLSDLHQNLVVTLRVPQESLLPRNVFPNKSIYVIKMKNIHRNSSTPPTNAHTYSSSDEVNGPSVPRIHCRNVNNINPPSMNPTSFPGLPPQFFVPPLFSNQRQQFINAMFSNQFARGFPPYFRMPPQFGRPRFFQFPYRVQIPPFMRLPNLINMGNRQPRHPNRRNEDAVQKHHLYAIKQLSSRLKSLLSPNNVDQGIVNSVIRLITTYNARFGARLRLNINFDVIEDHSDIETIEVEDNSPPQKTTRNNENSSKREKYLNEIKKISTRLQELERKGKAFARHRRAFSAIIKMFNKKFNAEIYLDDNNEIKDRRHITIDSSDSDCVIDEPPPKRKKLRNPFNILRSLSSERRERSNSPCSSVQSEHTDSLEQSNIFRDNWLPPSSDFGAATVVSKQQGNAISLETTMEMFLFDFVRDYNIDFENWRDLKILFWENVEEETSTQKPTKSNESDGSKQYLLTPEDCTDTSAVLEKIRIIPHCKDIADETSITIDFDVYNRDVQNFRKSNKPKPHFRIACIDETSSLPSGGDVAALYSKYPDDVTLVMAIVGSGSISYLQMKPHELPVHVPNSCSDENTSL